MAHPGKHSLRLAFLALAILAGFALHKADAKHHAECLRCGAEAEIVTPS